MRKFLVALFLLVLLPNICLASSENLFSKEQSCELKDLLLYFMQDENSSASPINWSVIKRTDNAIYWKEGGDGNVGLLINGNGRKETSQSWEDGILVKKELDVGLYGTVKLEMDWERDKQQPCKVFIAFPGYIYYNKFFRSRDFKMFFWDYLQQYGFEVTRPVTYEEFDLTNYTTFATIKYPSKIDTIVKIQTHSGASGDWSMLEITLFK